MIATAIYSFRYGLHSLALLQCLYFDSAFNRPRNGKMTVSFLVINMQAGSLPSSQKHALVSAD